MDLFSQIPHDDSLVPLAERLRPTVLQDFVGQRHIIGPNTLLQKLLNQNKLPSLILWGPPGVGKTTLAKILAKTVGGEFVILSAAIAGLKDVREVIEKARYAQQAFGHRTILFIDEIHRFNKSQQDTLLPHVEAGTITLVGATTENPSFEVVPALLSRCQVLILKALTADELQLIVTRALQVSHKPEDWLAPDLREFLIANAHGDARYLINLIADLLDAYPEEALLPLSHVQEHILKRSLLYDKNAEHHYNVISAFIKSMRDSDPDAALYYLARLIEGGENPLFIARRMVVFASEDIGNANAQAIQVAMACQQAFDFLGATEGWIPLAQCAVFLAGSPKSNASYTGYQNALASVKSFGALGVPLHLRNAPTKLMKQSGYGKDYKYAHNFVDHHTGQVNLPDQIADHRFYEPTTNGSEVRILDWLKKVGKR